MSSCGSASTTNAGSTGDHGEPDVAILRVEIAGCRDLVHEPGDADPLAAVFRAGQPDLTERAIHESDQARQASTQHRSGTAVDRHRSTLQGVKGEERTIQEVPKLVSGVPETLDLLFRSFLSDEPAMLRDRFSDRGVEAAVQGMKLFDGDRRALLDRDLGDRLADVAVVVDHLRDAEVGSQQLRAVPRGSGADRVTRERCCRCLQPQSLGQLGQKERYAVLEFKARDRRPGAASNPVPRPSHDVCPICVDELVQHHPRLGPARMAARITHPEYSAIR